METSETARRVEKRMVVGAMSARKVATDLLRGVRKVQATDLLQVDKDLHRPMPDLLHPMPVAMDLRRKTLALALNQIIKRWKI